MLLWNTFVAIQSLSRVRIFATPGTAACQAPLSSTISWSLLKLMSIELVMLSNHLILCRPLLLLPSIFPSSRSFPMSWLFISGGPSIGVSASASVLPKNIQGSFALGLPGLISLQSKGLSHRSSKPSVLWHSAFFMVQLSCPYVSTGKTIALTIQTYIQSTLCEMPGWMKQ